MPENVIEVAISFKDRVSAELAKVQANVNKATTVMRDNWQTITLASGAATAAMGMFARQTIRDAAGQQKADVELAAAMKAVGIESDSTFKSFKAYASEMQRMTVYGDEAVESAQALLLRLGTAPGTINRAVSAAADLSSVMGVDLHTATLAVGKALGGNMTYFQRLGIHIDDAAFKSKGATAIWEAMTKMEGAAAASANTLSGRTEQFKNQMGELRESLASGFLPVLQATTEHLTNLIAKFQELPVGLQKTIGATVGAGGGLALLGSASATVITPMLKLAPAVKDLANAVPALGSAAATAAARMAAPMSKIGQIAPVMTGGITGANSAIGMFASGLLAAGPIILAGGAAIALLAMTFKGYNEMKTAQIAEKDMADFEDQVVNSANGIRQCNARLKELASQGTTTGKEVEALTEKKKRLAEQSRKLSIAAGLNKDALRDLGSTMQAVGKDFEKFGDLYADLEKQQLGARKADLAALDREAAKKKEAGLNETDLARWVALKKGEIERKYYKESTDRAAQAEKDKLDAIMKAAEDWHKVEDSKAHMAAVHAATTRRLNQSLSNESQEYVDLSTQNAADLAAGYDVTTDAMKPITEESQRMSAAAEQALSAAGDFFGQMMKGGEDADAAMKNLLKSLLQIGLSMIPGLGPFAGFFGGLIGGMKEGGRIEKPIYAQSGWRDTGGIPIIGHEGEGVASRQGMGILDSIFGRAGATGILHGKAPQMVTAPVTVSNTFHIYTYDSRDMERSLRNGPLGKAILRVTREGWQIVNKRGVG